MSPFSYEVRLVHLSREFLGYSNSKKYLPRDHSIRFQHEISRTHISIWAGVLELGILGPVNASREEYFRREFDWWTWSLPRNVYNIKMTRCVSIRVQIYAHYPIWTRVSMRISMEVKWIELSTKRIMMKKRQVISETRRTIDWSKCTFICQL